MVVAGGMVVLQAADDALGTGGDGGVEGGGSCSRSCAQADLPSQSRVSSAQLPWCTISTLIAIGSHLHGTESLLGAASLVPPCTSSLIVSMPCRRCDATLLSGHRPRPGVRQRSARQHRAGRGPQPQGAQLGFGAARDQTGLWRKARLQHQKEQGGRRGPVPSACRLLVEACFRRHASPVHNLRDDMSGHATPYGDGMATVAGRDTAVIPTASLTASSDRGRLLSSRACKESAASAPSPGCMPQTCDLVVIPKMLISPLWQGIIPVVLVGITNVGFSNQLCGIVPKANRTTRASASRCHVPNVEQPAGHRLGTPGLRSLTRSSTTYRCPQPYGALDSCIQGWLHQGSGKCCNVFEEVVRKRGRV